MEKVHLTDHIHHAIHHKSPSKSHLLPAHFRQKTPQTAYLPGYQKKTRGQFPRNQSSSQGSNIVQTLKLPRLAIENQ
jgi:hypothetical protein